MTFHRVSDPYGAFTNYSRHPVIMKGMVWATAEHFFQASKFTDARHELLIRQAPTPARARALGRTRSVPLRPRWDLVRVEVMRAVLHAKFVQHPRLAHLLLGTGARRLVETTRRDPFWGAGPDGEGLNLTGRLLEGVREQLRSSPPPPAATEWAFGLDTCPQWVTFGDTTVVVPHRQRKGGGAACQAREVLLAAATAARPLTLHTIPAPAPHLRITGAAEAAGEILLRLPLASAQQDGTGLGRLLVSAATEPITWVHDARWPRERA